MPAIRHIICSKTVNKTAIAVLNPERMSLKCGLAALNWQDTALNWRDAALNWRDAALNWQDTALNWRDTALNWRDTALNWQAIFLMYLKEIRF